MAIMRDDKRFVSASFDRSIRIWDFKTRRLIRKIDEAHTGNIFSKNNLLENIACIVLTPDDKFMISGSFDRSIKVWNSGDLFCECNFMEAHKDTITALATSRDCQHFASAGEDLSIKYWSLPEKECLFTIEDAHKGRLKISFLSL
jgi:WD40 repeat protein